MSSISNSVKRSICRIARWFFLLVSEQSLVPRSTEDGGEDSDDDCKVDDVDAGVMAVAAGVGDAKDDDPGTGEEVV